MNRNSFRVMLAKTGESMAYCTSLSMFISPSTSGRAVEGQELNASDLWDLKALKISKIPLPEFHPPKKKKKLNPVQFRAPGGVQLKPTQQGHHLPLQPG